MNSIPILIIGAPCVLAVIAFKKAEKQLQHPKPKPSTDWQWPSRRWAAASTNERKGQS